jgi:hypothetical protein
MYAALSHYCTIQTLSTVRHCTFNTRFLIPSCLRRFLITGVETRPPPPHGNNCNTRISLLFISHILLLAITQLHGPKNKTDFQNIGDKVLWMRNFPVIQGNYACFPRITGKFPLRGLPPPIPPGIRQNFGRVYAQFHTHLVLFLNISRASAKNER